MADRHQRKSGQEFKNGKKELMERLCGSVAYWLVENGLISLLSSRTQDNQARGKTTYNRLGLLPYINN